MRADTSLADEHLLSVLASWDHASITLDIGGVADDLQGCVASVVVDSFLAAPAPIEEAVSEAFDDIREPVTLVGYDDVPEERVTTRVMSEPFPWKCRR